MINKFLPIFLLCVFLSFNEGYALDSISSTNLSGRRTAFLLTEDSGLYSRPQEPIDYQISFLSPEKQIINDIEQYRLPYHNSSIFILLAILLGLITYVKIAFENELFEWIQSTISRKFPKQISGVKSGEMSVLSFALHVNFILGVSLYVRFILTHNVYNTSNVADPSLLSFFFLFTLFYLIKLVAIEFVGIIFELKELCSEYAYHLTTMSKTLGLALIPVLFILYTSPKNINGFIFISSIAIILFLLTLFLWRGLSTGTKLLYSSAYHFFIYVCSMEISMMFLFFKLFTKTII